MFVFYIPLAITALLTTLTHTLFNAGLGRLSKPEIYISAFAVAKSLMHLFESPITMLRQTYSTLVVDQDSMRKVRVFCTWLITIIGILFAIFIYSPISFLIFTKLMNLDGETLSAAIVILRIIFFFPILSAIRNYYQGILIKFQATRLITLSTISRMFYVSIFVGVIGRFTQVPGSVLAGLMFLSALLVELIVLMIGKRLVVGNVNERILHLSQFKYLEKQNPLTYRMIFTFIGPLIVMGFIRSLGTPLVNAGLGQTYAPEIALSAYAVGWGLGNIAISPLGAFHQIPISFMSTTEEQRSLVKVFGFFVACFFSFCIFLMGYTSLGKWLLLNWIKAPADIIQPAVGVLRWMVILPFFVIVREYFWGMLMYQRKTKYLSIGKIVNLLSLTVTMFVVSFLNLANPALVGVFGMLGCEVVEIIYLFCVSKKEIPTVKLQSKTSVNI